MPFFRLFLVFVVFRVNCGDIVYLNCLLLMIMDRHSNTELKRQNSIFEQCNFAFLGR